MIRESKSNTWKIFFLAFLALVLILVIVFLWTLVSKDSEKIEEDRVKEFPEEVQNLDISHFFDSKFSEGISEPQDIFEPIKSAGKATCEVNGVVIKEGTVNTDTTCAIGP